MSVPTTEQRILTVRPGRGVREFGVPGDPAGNLGVAGIHFDLFLDPVNVLAGLPLAGANNTGAVYLSAIHGGLGSDPMNPTAIPTTTFNPNVPSFPNPQVTGYYTSGPNAGTPANGLVSTEKDQRTSDDVAANNATIWQPLNGRNNLNFALWLADGQAGSNSVIELYRDLNLQDKVLGAFGAGTGPADLENAMLLAQWLAPNAPLNQKMPSHCTSVPYHLPAGANLYLLFRSIGPPPAVTRAVGSIWFS